MIEEDEVIRVAIIDDEALVRSGFRMILEAAPGIAVVATADGIGAIEAVERTQPDVVLLDLRMPGTSGLEVLSELSTWAEPPVVAILTTFDVDDHVASALQAGAAGFLVKDTAPACLPAMIRSLAAGGVVLSQQASRALVSRNRSGHDAQARRQLALLTNRERDVLRHLATGAPNAQIGQALHLSTGTVKDHVSVILSKLQVSTRLQAAIIAERGGLR